MNLAEILSLVFGCLILACGAIIALFFLLGYITYFNQVHRPKKPISYRESPFAGALGPDFNEFADYTVASVKSFAQVPSVTIEVTTDDGLRLEGYFYRLREDCKNTVVFLHGYNSSSRNDFSAIAPFYRSIGYNILFTTARGNGASDGDYVGFGTLDQKDVAKWLDLVNELVPEGVIFIHGLSMGATTAMLASALDLPANVKGIIEDSGYTRIWDVFEFQIKQLFKLTPFPILHISEFFCKKFAKYNYRQANAIKAVEAATVPILFIHGSKDMFVPTYMGEASYEACTSPKKLLVVDGAGHCQSYWRNPELYEGTLEAFLTKTLSDGVALPEFDTEASAEEENHMLDVPLTD